MRDCTSRGGLPSAEAPGLAKQKSVDWFDVCPGMVIKFKTAPQCGLQLQEFSEKVMPVGDIEVAHLSAIDWGAVTFDMPAQTH